MEYLKKYKEFVVLILVIIFGLFFYVNQNNNQAITDFVSSYKKFDEAITYFTVAIYIPDDFGKNQNFLELDNIFSQIIGTFNKSASTDERLKLAKRALLLNMKEIDNLNQAGTLETEADITLIELSKKAAAIKNDDIRNTAIEISNVSKKEMDNIIAYRNVIQEKRNYTNDFFQKIIDDNGKLVKLLNFIKQEENPSKVENQNEKLDQLSKAFGNLNRDRKTAYARFEGLSGIKD